MCRKHDLFLCADFMIGGTMELYYIDSSYCHYLRCYDALVPYNEGVKKRPFIGVVIMIHSISFFAPLTSPKPKHRRMGNQIDFLKIDGGRLGAVNLNNMIPVQKGLYHKVSFRSDSLNAYTALLHRQLHWCILHQKEINEQANLLFQAVILRQAPPSVLNRCCDFYQDMLRLQLYCGQMQLLTGTFVSDFNETLLWIYTLAYRSDKTVIYV